MRSTDALCFPPLGKGFEKKPFRQPEISVCPGYLKSWLFKKSIQNIIFSCNREYLWLGFIPKLAAKQKDRGEQTQRWSGSNPNDSPRNSVFTQQLNKSSVNFFFFFLWPHLRHIEVPRLGVKLELQLPAYAKPQQYQIESHLWPTLQLAATPDP